MNFQILINKKLNWLLKKIDESIKNPNLLKNEYFNHETSLALIMLSLKKINNQKSKKLKDKIVNLLLDNLEKDFLKTKKEINLNNFFIKLLAILSYDKKIINGENIAKILKILTQAEQREGGPYLSFDNKKQPFIDIATNINIARFLKKLNVSLPSLEKLIIESIKKENYESAIYKSSIPSVYFLSNFYEKDKNKIKDFLLEKKNNDDENFLLDRCLIISALLKLGYPYNKLKKDINKIFCKEINSILIKALQLEIICLSNQDDQKTNQENQESLDEAIFIKKIEIKIKDKLRVLKPDLKKTTENIIYKILNKNKDKQIILLPYWFNKAMNANLNDEKVISLSWATLCLWTAYTIYDDFIDEEGNPMNLSTANFCLREFCLNFYENVNGDKEFIDYFNKLANKVDAMNTWEVCYCRTKVDNNKITKKEKLPDYKNYKRLSSKSITYSLGPITIAFLSGYKINSEEIKTIKNIFHHYLIARQLNDDAHDWEDDLKRGQLTSIVVEILNKTEQKIIDLDRLENIQKKFWLEIINETSLETYNHIKKAEGLIDNLKIIENKNLAKKMIIPTKKATEKALKEYKETQDLIKNYN